MAFKAIVKGFCPRKYCDFPLLACSQLQSLVAKTQWGQLTSVLHSLLEDRQSTPPSDSQGTPPPAELKPRPHRSVYRETLFFKAAIMGSINVGEVILHHSIMTLL